MFISTSDERLYFRKTASQISFFCPIPHHFMTIQIAAYESRSYPSFVAAAYLIRSAMRCICTSPPSSIAAAAYLSNPTSCVSSGSFMLSGLPYIMFTQIKSQILALKDFNPSGKILLTLQTLQTFYKETPFVALTTL